MECPRHNHLEQFLDGELPAAATAAIEQHLCRCDECLVRVATINQGKFPEIAGYTILREIGSGGFGRVYQAIHTAKQRIEALKVAKKLSERMARGFANEVHLIAQLQHPNIATLYETRLAEEPRYFAMEYIEGVQFDAYLARSGANLRDALKLLIQIVQAIEYAHQRGVAHRDIKPQNILVTDDGVPRVVDFGIGKRIAASDDAGMETLASGESPAGTLGYMAPEQMFGHHSDARSDIFSLGVLLFHIVTGKPAKALQRSNRLVRLLRARRMSRPLDLAAIIAHCTADDPERRYESCAQLADDLQRYLDSRVVTARSEVDWRHRLSRAAGFALQHYPAGAFVATTVMVIALLVGATAPFKPSRLVAGNDAVDRVLLVGLDETSRDAIAAGAFAELAPAANATNPVSLRPLHAAVMDKLADAGARVVVWDYFFKRCSPADDELFSQAVANAGVPAVAGTKTISSDGEPEVCAALAKPFYGIGTLTAGKETSRSGGMILPLAVKRKNSPLVPSLALLGACAARMPDHVPHFEREKSTIEVRYRRRDESDGARWASHTDVFAFSEISRADRGSLLFDPEDQQFLARVSHAAIHAQTDVGELLRYADVLRLDVDELRAIVADRVVLIGQMTPPQDYIQLRDGTWVFGCQVQAAMLQNLLQNRSTEMVRPLGLFLRFGLGAVIGALLGVWLAQRVSIAPRRTLMPVAALFIGGCIAASAAAINVTNVTVQDFVFPAMAGVMAFAAVFHLQQIRTRQILISPRTHWASDASTLSSRHLVETATLRMGGA